MNDEHIAQGVRLRKETDLAGLQLPPVEVGRSLRAAHLRISGVILVGTIVMVGGAGLRQMTVENVVVDKTTGHVAAIVGVEGGVSVS